MTLILAIPTSDGIVLASDGQVTHGDVRAVGEKLFPLSRHCAWGGAGEVALIQRVGESIAAISVDQPLSLLRDQLANAIKQCVTSLLQLDFRTQFFQGNPQALLSLHPGDFVFAECRANPTVLHVTSYGTPEWIERPFAIGNGAPFAYALLQKYHRTSLGMEQASLVALKVIEEAIQVGAYGLGPPVFIWQITTSGISQLPESHVAALADSAKELREQEIQLLVGQSVSEGHEEQTPTATSAAAAEGP